MIRDRPLEGHQKETVDKITLFDQVRVLWQILKTVQFWNVSLIGAVLFIPINVLASLWGIDFIQSKLFVTESYAAGINAMLFVGSAVGYIVVSVISAYIKNYRIMLVISSFLLTIISTILIFVSMPIWVFVTLFTLLGVSIGPQALTFEIGKHVSPEGATASAVSGVNMMNNLVAAILLPVFGWMLASSAHGASGVLPLNDYYYAMSMLPILTLICVPFCLLLPKKIGH